MSLATMSSLFVLPFIVCLLTLTLAILAGITNVYLVVTVFWTRRSEKKSDLTLIYSRFCMDIVYDICCFGFLSNMFWNLIYEGSIKRETLIFLVSWSIFIMGSLRVTLVSIITLERTLAACFPVEYHNYRSKVSLSSVIIFMFIYIVALNTGIFYHCGFDYSDDSAECEHFGCTIKTCYYTNWLSSELVMYLLIGTLTVILCIRIFIWNHCTNAHTNSKLTRVIKIRTKNQYQLELRKRDLALIYSRFCVDMVYDFGSSVNLSIMVWNLITTGSLQYNNLIFLTAWPNFNLGSIRIMLVFFITLERTLAACVPIGFHNYRSKIALPAFYFIIFVYILAQNTVIFNMCDFYFFNDPTNCEHFGCAVIQCYYYKWLVTEEVMYLLIGLLTVILCLRLLIWNHCTHAPKNSNLTRANRIAILDVFIIFAFDLLPSFLLAYFSTSLNLTSIGPLMFMTKYFGIVIESVVVCKVLIWRGGKNKPNHSTIVTPS